MSKIKEGALVKAWDDEECFIVGEYIRFVDRLDMHEIFVNSHDTVTTKRCVEIPDDLVEKLKGLGK